MDYFGIKQKLSKKYANLSRDDLLWLLTLAENKKAHMSGKSEDGQMVVLKSGLKLYRVRPINTPDAREMYKTEYGYTDDQITAVLGDVEGELKVDVGTHPKFFGLTREFPYFYGADDVNNGAIEYVTTRPIVLLDVGVKMGVEENISKEKLLQEMMKIWVNPGKKAVDIPEFISQFDGWIGYDDNDTWREIYLFKPQTVVGMKGKRYKLDAAARKQVKDWDYRYGNEKEELEILEDYTLKCIPVKYTHNDVEIDDVQVPCDTPSLKPFAM